MIRIKPCLPAGRYCVPIILALLLSLPAHAAGEFKKHNPDGGKYEFLRSYITALSYLHNIDQRWSKKPPKTVFAGDDLKVVRGHIAYLVMDNADLRITKNYMEKYLSVPNSLMRKVADTVSAACERAIAVNEESKRLWDQWLAIKLSGNATYKNERQFVSAQEGLDYKRKEIDKTIIEASLLAVTIAKSAGNADERGTKLAFTSVQRDKLLARLDTFGKDTLDWGLKPGQKTLQASVAVLREVLEDPIYTSIDE